MLYLVCALYKTPRYIVVKPHNKPVLGIQGGPNAMCPDPPNESGKYSPCGAVQGIFDSEINKSGDANASKVEIEIMEALN